MPRAIRNAPRSAPRPSRSGGCSPTTSGPCPRPSRECVRGRRSGRAAESRRAANMIRLKRTTWSDVDAGRVVSRGDVLQRDQVGGPGTLIARPAAKTIGTDPRARMRSDHGSRLPGILLRRLASPALRRSRRRWSARVASATASSNAKPPIARSAPQLRPTARVERVRGLERRDDPEPEPDADRQAPGQIGAQQGEPPWLGEQDHDGREDGWEERRREREQDQVHAREPSRLDSSLACVRGRAVWAWRSALPISHGSGDAASAHLGFDLCLGPVCPRSATNAGQSGSKRASKRSGPANREPPPRIIRPPAKWRPATEGSNK